MLRYVTVSELIYINGRVLNDENILTGKQKVREIELLDAAAARPAASAFGADAYPTLREKASVLFHSIARNHPFRDGNKRTATVALLFMLDVNGQRVVWEPAEALNIILDVAEGRKDHRFMMEWLPLQDGNTSLEADFDRDTAMIESILDAHRWLLDELAER